MAARNLTQPEIIINMLFWAAMALSGFGLLIYGAYQLFLKLSGKPFHSFKLDSKESKLDFETIDVLKDEKTTENPLKPSYPSVREFLDLEIKRDVDSYLQKLHTYNEGHEEDDKPPLLVIDLTPSQNKLMSETDKIAYDAVLQKRKDFILNYLVNQFGQLSTTMFINFKIPSQPWAEKPISINNPPQAMLDYYDKLAQSPFSSKTDAEFFEMLILFSVERFERGDDKHFAIRLNPKELRCHSFYQFLNIFIKQIENPAFRNAAFAQLHNDLGEYSNDIYGVALNHNIPLADDKYAFSTPATEEIPLFLNKYREKNPKEDPIEDSAEPKISHSADPTFSAKGAKKLQANKVKSSTRAEEAKELDNVEKSRDSDSQSAPSV